MPQATKNDAMSSAQPHNGNKLVGFSGDFPTPPPQAGVVVLLVVLVGPDRASAADVLVGCVTHG